MNEMKVYARWGLLVFFVLGITSGIGAIQHGNSPFMSFSMSALAFTLFFGTLGN